MGNLYGSNIVAPPLSARKVKQSCGRERSDDRASIFQSLDFLSAVMREVDLRLHVIRNVLQDFAPRRRVVLRRGHPQRAIAAAEPTSIFGAKRTCRGCGNLIFKQGIGQLKASTFIGAGIEEHQRPGTETFDLANVMLAKSAPLVQSTRVCKGVSPTCSVDMEVNRLLADRTL